MFAFAAALLPLAVAQPPVPKLVVSLEGHTSEVYAVAFSPDGKTLASAGMRPSGLGKDRPNAEVRVFVTNEKSDDVTVIQADTGTVLKTLAVGKRPRGVTASADGSSAFIVW